MVFLGMQIIFKFNMLNSNKKVGIKKFFIYCSIQNFYYQFLQTKKKKQAQQPTSEYFRLQKFQPNLSYSFLFSKTRSSKLLLTKK